MGLASGGAIVHRGRGPRPACIRAAAGHATRSITRQAAIQLDIFAEEGVDPAILLGANAGIRSRPASILPGILPTRVGTALGLGLSGGFYADGDRAVAIGAEFVSDFTVGADARLLIRAQRWRIFVDGSYRIAGGPFELGRIWPGIGQGAGSPDMRVMVFFGRAPEQMAPPPDRDEDGVPDKTGCMRLDQRRQWPDPLLNGVRSSGGP